MGHPRFEHEGAGLGGKVASKGANGILQATYSPILSPIGPVDAEI